MIAPRARRQPAALSPPPPRRRWVRGVLPGFGLTAGITVAWLSLVVLVPLSALALQAAALTPARAWAVVSAPRALAAYRLSFAAALAAAAVNVPLGLLVAWVLARYRFPGRALVDAVVDLPFALPTAVSGIALTTVYARHGVMGRLLEPLGIRVAYTPLGVALALAFIGLPFVVRSVQPVLEEADPEVEEAAAMLGAGRWTTFRRVVLPALLPALGSGFALAFARGLGEYGSVVFISGGLPLRTEIAPLLIMGKLEAFDRAGAAALACVLLAVSFVLLLALGAIGRRRQAGALA